MTLTAQSARELCNECPVGVATATPTGHSWSLSTGHRPAGIGAYRPSGDKSGGGDDRGNRPLNKPQSFRVVRNLRLDFRCAKQGAVTAATLTSRYGPARPRRGRDRVPMTKDRTDRDCLQCNPGCEFPIGFRRDHEAPVHPRGAPGLTDARAEGERHSPGCLSRAPACGR